MASYVALIDSESGAFGAVVPDPSGCTSAGGTVENALRNAAEAVRLRRNDARADGEAIPEPRPIESLQRDPEIAAALARGAVLGLAPARELAI
jgi:predicted RNase H-like HicB family nuclease